MKIKGSLVSGRYHKPISKSILFFGKQNRKQHWICNVSGGWQHSGETNQN